MWERSHRQSRGNGAADTDGEGERATTVVPYGPSLLSPGARAAVERWVDWNGCECEATGRPSVDLSGEVAGDETVIEVWDQCDARGSVELWTIEGGTHVPLPMVDDAGEIMNSLGALRQSAGAIQDRCGGAAPGGGVSTGPSWNSGGEGPAEHSSGVAGDELEREDLGWRRGLTRGEVGLSLFLVFEFEGNGSR